jgi:hypothetical protein
MQREVDRCYYRERAEAELACAREAKAPEARRAHSILAGYYFDLAFRARNEATDKSEAAAPAAPILNGTSI